MPCNVDKKSAVHAPVRVVIAQLAEAGIDEVRRVADNEVPLLGSRNVLQIVREINRDAAFERIACNGAPAGCRPASRGQFMTSATARALVAPLSLARALPPVRSA